MMNRKKFFALFSTSIVGMALLKASPIKFFNRNKNTNIKVKLNPDAVKREKSGKKNG